MKLANPWADGYLFQYVHMNVEMVLRLGLLVDAAFSKEGRMFSNEDICHNTVMPGKNQEKICPFFQGLTFRFSQD